MALYKQLVKLYKPSNLYIAMRSGYYDPLPEEEKRVVGYRLQKHDYEIRHENVEKMFHDLWIYKYGYPTTLKPPIESAMWVLDDTNDRGEFLDFMAKLHKKYDFSYKAYRRWKRRGMVKAREYDQRFIKSRHNILGSDLAAAHFIIYRNGAVKFKGMDEWFTKKNINELPQYYDPKYKVEAIDAAKSELLYVGFDNLINLTNLKSLSLRECPFIDDFCLERLTQYSATLQHLDISGCSKITSRGLFALHRLYHLQSLNVENIKKIECPELACLLLEETYETHIPEIYGINYLAPPEKFPELPAPEEIKPETKPEKDIKFRLL